MFSRENIITFCYIILKEFLACWDLELLFPLPHQTTYNPALLCIILFQIWTIWILQFMLARKFGWLYFIIALEKKGRVAAKLSLYSFSLLKSSEETVVVLITYSSFYSPLLLACGISKLWLCIFLWQQITAACPPHPQGVQVRQGPAVSFSGCSFLKYPPLSWWPSDHWSNAYITSRISSKMFYTSM